MTILNNQDHNQENNSFISLRDLLGRSHIFKNSSRVVSIADLASAIEQSGIYTWDKYGRCKLFKKDDPEIQKALTLLERIYSFESDFEPKDELHPLELTEDDPDDPYCSFGWENSSLPDFDSIHTSRAEINKKVQINNQRTDANNLNIIASLLAYIKGEMKGIDKHPSFESEALLIKEIEAEYSRKFTGLSQRNLEGKFAEAKRKFKATST